jgi:iron complex outermembrane receptor protein
MKHNSPRHGRRDAPGQRTIIRLALLSSLFPLLASAGTTSAIELLSLGPSEEQYFDELPVVVSVTRLPQTSLELPASLTVIDRRMIEASGVNDIPELLRLVAGFQIAHVSGNRYAVTYHGMGDDFARRIQVLVDGRSVYMPATSSVDWVDLPLAIEDVDRIEVLRGPNGVAFGDNSFSGVVNIITQEAKSARGSYVRVQGGQGNYRRAVARQGGKMGDLDLRLTFEHQSDDGLDDVTRKNGSFSSIKDDKLSNKLNLRGDWRAGVNDYVQLHAGLNSGTRGTGYNPASTTGDYPTSPAFDSRNWRHYEQLKWRHIVSSDNELQLQAYHDYTDTRATYQTLQVPIPIPVVFEVPGDIVSERYALELEHRFRISDSLRTVWGGEARLDQVTAPGFLNSEEPQQNSMYRGFAHTEWQPAADYLVNLGAMLEHNEIAGTHLSPRLAVNYRLTDDHAMRISATRAYRTPAILEEYADRRATVVGNEVYYAQLWKSEGNLQSERITSYELGWMGNLGGPHTQYDFKLFKEEIRDVISHPLWLSYASSSPTSIPNNTIYFFNRDWADLEGAELQLKSVTADDTMLSFSYSYVRATGTITDRLNPENVEQVSDNVPTHTFSWLVEHPFGANWRGSLAFYYVDHIDFWSDTSVSTADVRLARRFKHGENEGELAIVGRDIWGAYYDYHDEREINPRVYLSLGYRF